MKKEKEIYLQDRNCLQYIKSIMSIPDIEDNTKLIRVANPTLKTLFLICSRSHDTLASPNKPRIPKGDAVHLLDVILEITDALENQPGSLAHRMATLHMLRLRLCSLPTQVTFNVVHHLRWPAESLLRRRARTKENALGLL
jgi:hypothetical protein